jgi:alpha-glucosidase
MKGNLRNFENAMNYFMTRFMTPSLYCAMNELSNHDHSRFLTRTNHKVGRAAQLGCEAASQDVDKAVMKEAVVFQMTWPGAPTVYYGDEVGVCGFTDPDNRRTYPWGGGDTELFRFHKEMIRIHKQYQTLRTGSVKFLDGQDNVLCYARFDQNDQFVVILNNDTVSRSLNISVRPGGVPRECEMEQLIYTTEKNFSTVPVCYQVHQGHLQISLPGKSALVLKRK